MTSLTKIENPWTDERVQLLKMSYFKDSTNEEFNVFLEICKMTGLNPFVRQIYPAKYGGVTVYMTSIDGFRLIAQRTGLYAGQAPVEWCGIDGKWKDIWLDASHPPFAAKVTVYRRGFEHQITAVARYRNHAKNNNFWKDMPDLMIAKCAESQALRKAFPNELSGLYTWEEMPEESDEQPREIHDSKIRHLAQKMQEKISSQIIDQEFESEIQEEENLAKSMILKIDSCQTQEELLNLIEPIKMLDKNGMDICREVYKKKKEQLVGIN